MPRPNKVWKRKNTDWFYVNIGKKVTLQPPELILRFSAG